jgi:drug/metabolite transporter (DMT)-like permease
MNPSYALGCLSSLLFGSADFLGGVAAKRSPAPAVAILSGVGGLVAVLVALPFFRGTPQATDLAWGAAAGVCGAVSVSLMYRALALGPMSLASPVFSLIGLCVPVLLGLAWGERPHVIAWIGVALAVLAIPLLSVTGEGHGIYSRAHVRRTFWISVAAGLVVGWFLVCLFRIGHHAGFWPLAVARVAGVTVLAGFLLVQRRALLPAASVRAPALLSGVLDSTANIAFLIAVRGGPLVLISALVSLAPATTVLIARFTLGERWTAHQALGLAMALAAGVCLSIGG